jgi:hypothetical protein
MVAYTGIQGQNILIVSSDPSNPTEGQIWYNSTTNLLKGYAFVAAAWATGGNLNTARRALMGAGTQTAGLAFGGTPGAPNNPTGASENYNGTSWTNAPGTLSPAVREGNGVGTQTAALSMGGAEEPNSSFNYVSKYNGSTWTSSTNMPTGGRTAGTCGTQTAALYIAGWDQPPGTTLDKTTTLKFDGTSWTTTGSVPQRQYTNQSAGTQTAALNWGGGSSVPPSPITSTISFDGTSWTSLPATLNVSSQRGLGFCGTQTAALAFGGTPSNNATEVWNGTSWAISANLSSARGGLAGATNAPNTAGLAFGGDDGASPVASTEEFTGASLNTRTITTS